MPDEFTRDPRPYGSSMTRHAVRCAAALAVTKDLDKDGDEAGAATIAFHLEQRHGTAPAVSTI